MLHLDSDTLAFWKENPFFRPINFSEVPVPELVKKINNYMNGAHKVCPEVEAIDFYLLNHAFSLISSKYGPYMPLPEWANEACSLYATRAADIFPRLFYYMTLICTRESRHARKSNSWMPLVLKTWGVEYHRFHQSISGQGSNGAVDALLNNPPNMKLGEYARALVWTFHKGSYHGGYGGKAWAKVADALSWMVNGQTSPEIMVDTAWTLCHNNGPIFNKGMVYSGYTNVLKVLLDVQRSGQIPQYCAENEGMDMVIQTQYSKVKELMPQEMSGYVDWFKVEALGALGKYSQQKAEQAKKHGTPQGVAAEEATGMAEHSKTEAPSDDVVWVTDTSYVQKIPRPKAA